MKETLRKSFVARFYRFRTYDALDSFAKHSDLLIDILGQIHDECRAIDNREAVLIVDRMLENMQNFYCKYKEYIGIRKKVFCHHEISRHGNYTEYKTYYITLGHQRSHFITLVRQYVEFIDKHFKNMQDFHNIESYGKKSIKERI